MLSGRDRLQHKVGYLRRKIRSECSLPVWEAQVWEVHTARYTERRNGFHVCMWSCLFLMSSAISNECLMDLMRWAGMLAQSSLDWTAW